MTTRSRRRIFAAGGFVVFGAGAVTLVLVAGATLGVRLSAFGMLNLAVIILGLYWYALDASLPRRSVYGLWGWQERPLKPELRLWRRIVLLSCALATLASCLIVLTPTTADARTAIPAAALPLVAVLTAAFLAALGWMYTAFEKEKTDRAAQTLTAIREQLSGDYIREVYSQIRALNVKYRADYDVSKEDPLPLEAMACRLGALPRCDRPKGRPSRTLGGAVDEFLNALDHLAFGVRQGQFDFRSIEMVLRQRYVRSAFAFYPYLEQQTRAIAEGERRRSTVRTWEHYLWLVSCLELLPGDEIDRARLVLPPRRIIGTR